ncbi:hypothetical protein J3U68_03540 [Snodgrassella sp. B3882]|uniref:hypothetical protein n=1 Tax=Snodgrassella sp. B3882 TaxID=2818037 RepID=UPI00226A7BBA|nr:hypothetical protein [Snodgrassella sp. B3882]MCX8744484.1 hypothetical protein [Snodgrassella sp. B3882]
MLLKKIIKGYYNELFEEDKSKNYDDSNIRGVLSTKASGLLEVLDEKDMNGENIDKKIISFLNFISGYDTPRFEDDGYLYDKNDLEREYAQLGNLDSLEGADIECKYI